MAKFCIIQAVYDVGEFGKMSAKISNNCKLWLNGVSIRAILCMNIYAK